MDIPWSSIPQRLEDLGYRPVAVVSDKKQFAIRNGIVDVFPISSSDPYRIEFFGDTVDSLRIFDPIKQTSIEKKEEVFLAPAEEKHLLEKKPLQPLWQYFAKTPLIVFDDLASLEDHYVSFGSSFCRPSKCRFSMKELFEKIDHAPQIFFTKQPLQNLSSVQKKGEKTTFSMFDLDFTAALYHHPFHPMGSDLFFEGSKFSYHFLYENPRYQSVVLECIQKHNLQNHELIAGYLSSGFVYENHVVVTEKDLTQKKKVIREKWRSSYHSTFSDFHALVPGELVVHLHSGIGKYLGTEKQKNHLGIDAEFLVIAYAKASKLYVPISQSHLVSKYIGSSEKQPALTELGSKKWHQVKTKAQKDIVGYASDLLHLYAERQLDSAKVHAPDSSLMQEFEAEFAYEETADQLLAISAIKEDLQKSKPMDRLLSGDVGYGKTEVAMRAAFKAVVDGGGQVALLVPTTVLAMQHFDTFVARMNNYPVEIGVISRFQTAKKNRETLEKTAAGKIDILIGTHRILSKDVSFQNLILLIIDEEQRFGVRAKESLKKRKKSVHSLALSATPIPRTLYMSLIGARDVSVMATPPDDRLPIKTILAETDDTLIKQAILRELAREGQAFFIHNRVESIYQKQTYLQKLVPQAKIGVAHGQMHPDAIDDVFHAFREGALDVLLATVIVENGIDVPNANTILIERADCYGVSDLYQLRGRVGRWNRSSYAYFLLPKNRSIKEPSQKRLQALVQTSGYGGGMKLAKRDLELRGAGDILGEKQSGQVASIGFHLYCMLLKRVIRSLQEKKPITFVDTKMEFLYPAFFPEEYIPENALRMELYHKLGEAESTEAIEAIKRELTDRFGPLPSPVVFLLHLANIRVFASMHQFTKLRFTEKELFAERTLGEKTYTKRIFLPQSLQSPTQLEDYVLQKLKEEFLQKTVRSFLKKNKPT